MELNKSRLGTTSFIIKAGWSENVKFLKDKVGNIMLLLLEADEQQMPSKAEMEELKNLQDKFDVKYSIHLPHYSHLGSPNNNKREKSVNDILKVIDFVNTSGIKYEYFVLHPDIYQHSISLLQKSTTAFEDSLQRILENIKNSKKLALETIHFNFFYIQDLIEKYNTSVIIDVGQSIRYGYDYFEYTKVFIDRIVDIHLHGFDGKHDHQSLKYFNHKDLTDYLNLLGNLNYNQNILIEVHSESKLYQSIKILNNYIK